MKVGVGVGVDVVPLLPSRGASPFPRDRGSQPHSPPAPAPAPRRSSTFAAPAMQGAPRFVPAQAAALGQGSGDASAAAQGQGSGVASAAAQGRLMVVSFNVDGTNYERQGDANFIGALQSGVSALLTRAAP